jgi:hypothetical protein
MDLGLPGIYYNDLVICVPNVAALAGIPISVNGTPLDVTDDRGLRLCGPARPVTPMYRRSGAIDLRIAWVRPADVAVVEPPPTVHDVSQRKPRQTFQQPIGKAG